MAHDSAWISYSGTARAALAIVLLIAAAGVSYAGARLPLPARTRRPGPTVANLMIAVWITAITAFVACTAVLAQVVRKDHLSHVRPPDPITPVTLTAVAVIFVLIVLISGSYDWPTRVAGAAIGALAAPMIFELPFDLIVMARTYPPVTGSYRALFFAPLFLVELSTLALGTLSPMVRISRTTFFGFAAILVVFAAWGLSGFGYPSAPFPYAMNVVSKILAFITALTLFLPQRAKVSAPRPAQAPEGRLIRP